MLLKVDAWLIRGFGERNSAIGYLGDEFGGILGCFGASGPTAYMVSSRPSSWNIRLTQ